MPRTRILTAAAAAAVLAATLAGCAAGTARTAAHTGAAACPAAARGRPAAPGKGGDLVFEFAAAPVNLDPSTTQDNASSMQMMNAWFQELIAPAGSGFQPVLASSWAVSSDGLDYTFRIRPGVTFSDGAPLTAADVAFSLNRNIKPAVSVLNFLSAYVKSITATGPLTVQIRLARRWPNLLADLASPNGAIYPAGAFSSKTAGAFFTRHPVGTGPFTLTSEIPGAQYVVTARPGYWDTAARPHLAKITFVIDTSDTSRAAAVLGGQADVALSPPPAQVATYCDNSQVKVSEISSSLVEIICLNLSHAPLNNADVRQAISLALNKQAIIQSGLSGLATPATTYFVGPPNQTYQDPHLNLYPFNLARARKLMRESGVHTPLTLQLEVSTGAAQNAIATIATADLAKIGIQVKVSQLDEASVDSSIIAEHYQMATTFFGDLNSDSSVQPLFAIDPHYCCNAYFTGLNDPRLTALTWRAVDAGSHTQAQALYDQVQRQFAAQASLVPLYYPDLVHLVSAKVTGFDPDSYGFYNWAQIGLRN